MRRAAPTSAFETRIRPPRGSGGAARSGSARRCHRGRSGASPSARVARATSILDGGDGLGPGVAVGDVVPELERLPTSRPNTSQRTLGLRPGPGERRADQHRALGGVRAGLQRADTGRGRARPRRRGTARPPSRSACGRSGPSPHRAGPVPNPLVRRAARTARAPRSPDQDRRRRPERLRVHTGRRVASRTGRGRVDAAALGVPVHQVVVHEGGRAWSFERRAGPGRSGRLHRRPPPGTPRSTAPAGPASRRRGAGGAARPPGRPPRSPSRPAPRGGRRGTARARGRPVRGRPGSPSTVARARCDPASARRQYANAGPGSAASCPPCGRRAAIVLDEPRLRTMTRFQKLTIATTASTVLLITAGGSFERRVRGSDARAGRPASVDGSRRSRPTRSSSTPPAARDDRGDPDLPPGRGRVAAVPAGSADPRPEPRRGRDSCSCRRPSAGSWSGASSRRPSVTLHFATAMTLLAVLREHHRELLLLREAADQGPVDRGLGSEVRAG